MVVLNTDGATTTAQFECDVGFSINGSSSLSCGKEGIWTTEYPNCGNVYELMLKSSFIKFLKYMLGYLVKRGLKQACVYVREMIKAQITDQPTVPGEKECFIRSGEHFAAVHAEVYEISNTWPQTLDSIYHMTLE